MILGPVRITDVHISIFTLAADGAIDVAVIVRRRAADVKDFRRVRAVFFVLATRHAASKVSVARDITKTAPVHNVRALLRVRHLLHRHARQKIYLRIFLQIYLDQFQKAWLL